MEMNFGDWELKKSGMKYQRSQWMTDFVYVPNGAFIELHDRVINF
jgi:hypothetical protein